MTAYRSISFFSWLYSISLQVYVKIDLANALLMNTWVVTYFSDLKIRL